MRFPFVSFYRKQNPIKKQTYKERGDGFAYFHLVNGRCHFFTIDAIIGNQAFSQCRCNKSSGLIYN